MADVLRLANIDQSTTVNLYNGTLKLREGTWTTRSAPVQGTYAHSPYGPQAQFSHFGPVVEVIDLVGDDTTANLRSAQQEIYAVLEGARMYNHYPLWTRGTGANDPPESWWLEWNVDGESAKRALIYEGSLSLLQGIGLSPMLEDSKMLARLVVTRHPFWEETTTWGVITNNSISCWGGTETNTSVAGDVPARMRFAQIRGINGGGSSLYRAWVGIREKLNGTANFEPIWELEDGSNSGGASDSTSRANYSGTAHVRKSSPASSLTKYVSMTVDDACSHSDYAHQEGEYLVLCRCAIDSGTVGLQLRYGFRDSTVMMPAEEVFITNTDWRLIELGRIQIPPTGIDELMDTTYAQYTEIEIWAEQVSGTSVLDLDALCLIPTHHFWSMSGANIYYFGVDTYSALATTTPNDKQTCYGYESAVPSLGMEYALQDWYLPTDDSILVLAGEGETSHDKSVNVGITIQYWPRWAIYR